MARQLNPVLGVFKVSAHVRKCPTKIRRVHNRIPGKNRRRLPRKKCNLQSTSRRLSDHPLRILRAAQTVLLQESLRSRNIQSIKTGATCTAALRVEDRRQFLRLQTPYPSDRKRRKVDRNLLLRQGHIARDGLGCCACRTPVPSILSHSRHAANQHRPDNRTQ